MCEKGHVWRRSIDSSNPEIVRNTRLIAEVCHRWRLSCPQTAYVLATAFHESRLGLWMDDFASRGDGDPIDEHRYRGRGFARLRGRSAYAAWAEYLDLPLLDRPELAARPEIAARILVEGMMRGRFTGHALADYINDHHVDYAAARCVMAPRDRPVRVAGYARAFEARLEGTTSDEPTTSDVRRAQQQLAAIGWPLIDDGLLGRFTTRAIHDFQAGYCHTSLGTDGHLDPVTRIAIETCVRNDGFASDHFRFAEFRTAGPTRLCETNRVIRVERELVRGLETYRHFLGGPVKIACGYRSAHHNAAVGARPDSEHVAGRAVDLRHPELPVDAVAQLGAFSSIGHRAGLAVHLGVSGDGPTTPRVYPMDGEAAAPPPGRPLATPLGDASDSGDPLADAGHRSQPVLQA
ncbi:MAG: D-Ala-D-Ala carboxypeptidase family metallohydrolase [Acidimicrobiales bacterium]